MSRACANSRRSAVDGRPIIGIVPKKVPSGEDACIVAQNYLDSVIAAGGVPLVMPITSDARAIEQLLALVDAILLIGGADISPACYGEAPVTELETTPQRDEIERHVLDVAQARELTVFGICRGLQMINAYFGGTLYQDLPTQFTPASGHALDEHLAHDEHGDYDGDRLVHRVTLIEGSQLAQIFRATELEVNSLHHQAVRTLAAGFVATAISPDGVIEGIESEDGRFVAVQWHPEYFGCTKPMSRFFQALVEHAR